MPTVAELVEAFNNKAPKAYSTASTAFVARSPGNLKNYHSALNLELSIEARILFATLRRILAMRNENPWPNVAPCEVCGSVGKIYWHHDDYSKPFEVRPFCYKHHTAWHRPKESE